MMDVKRKVDRVYELFDQQRLESSKRRLRAVWTGRMPEDRLPFVFSYYPFKSKLHGLLMDFGYYSVEETLHYYLDACIAHANLDDDYIPSVYPGLRQGVLATAFGCEEIRVGDQFYVKPVITKVDDIFELARPDVRATGLTKTFIERIGALHRATEGRLPVHGTVQGVVSTAAMMWSATDLMLAFYDHPEAVHHLLDILTDAFIEFVKAQIEVTEGTLIPIHCMPYAWFPPGAGMADSEDDLALISPAIFTEFVKPCLERISDAFGGLVIHSCGCFKNLLGPLKTVRGLKGVNFGVSETALEDAAAVLSPTVTLIPHTSSVACGPLKVLSQREHVERTIPYCIENCIPAQVLVHVEPGDVPVNTAVISRGEVDALNELAVSVSRIRSH